MAKMHNHVLIILDVNSIPMNPNYIFKVEPNKDTTLNNIKIEAKDSDVNKVPNNIPNEDGPKLTGNEIVPLNFDFPDPPEEDYNFPEPEAAPMYTPEMIKSVSEMVLLLLCQEALVKHGKSAGTFDFSTVTWSFKFYNSSLELNSNTGKKFLDFDISAFEMFEKQLGTYLNPPSPQEADDKAKVNAYNKSLELLNKSRPDVNEIGFLSTALKSVISDLKWIPPMSYGKGSKNVIYTFLRVPRNDEELYNFYPDFTERTADFLAKLLPTGFIKQMRSQEIQLNFVDFWKALPQLVPDVTVKLENPEDEFSYPRVINRILHYINGGRVFPFNVKIGGDGIPYGFPSYMTMLRNQLTSSRKEKGNQAINSSNLTLAAIHKLTNGQTATATTTTKSKGASTTTNKSLKVSPIEIQGARSAAGSRGSLRPGSYVRIPHESSQQQKRMGKSKMDEWSHVNKGYSRRVLEDNPVIRKSAAVDHHLQQHSRRLQSEELAQQLSRKRKYEEAERVKRQQRGYAQMDLGVDLIDNRSAFILETEYEDNLDDSSEFEPLAGYRNQRALTGSSQQQQHQHQQRSRQLAVEDHRSQRRPSNDRSMGYTPSPSPRVQPTKRIRRDEATLAAIERARALKQRHSDPVAPPAARNKPNNNTQQSAATFRASTGSRGRAMLDEVQKRKLAQQNNPAKTKSQKLVAMNKSRPTPLTAMKTRLNMFVDTSGLHDTSNPLQYIVDKIDMFKEIILVEEDSCLFSAAQAIVSILAGKLMKAEVPDIRRNLEEVLILPFDKLNMNVLKKMYSKEERQSAFRECELQILLRFEITFISPLDDQMQKKENEQLQEEVIRILNLISAYRKKPTVEGFINDVLVAEYHQLLGRLLLEVSYAVNISISPLLSTYEDNESQGEESDQESVTSSTHSSINLGDSVSTLGIRSPHHKSRLLLRNSVHHHSQQQRSSRMPERIPQDSSQHLRMPVHHSQPLPQYPSFLQMHNDKRKILVPASAKSYTQQSRQINENKSKQLTRSATAPRSSPKRVRRNLFDVQASSDPNELKALLSLSRPSFAKSPSLFRSPSSKKSFSPHSPSRMSPFFRAARSRRRLVLDPENDDVGTVQQWEPLRHSSDDIMCPESPATPKRRTPAPGSAHGSAEARSCIQESPEVAKNQFGAYSSRLASERVNSISFYSSTGSESQKSRAWARSGAKLMAARIKDTVDLSSSLTLNDLEFLSHSPAKGISNQQQRYSDSKKWENNNTNREPQSPVACSSKTNQQHHVVTSEDVNINYNIEALMTSEILPTNSDIFNMNSSNHSSLHTPSKRVQFNLLENLVNTPSPARYPIQATPRSILKDGGSSELH